MTSQTRHLRHALALAALTLSLVRVLNAQSPVYPVSASEKAFAQSLVPMTLEDAQSAIAKAAPSDITPGSAIALRDLGNGFIDKHPETSLLFYRKAVEVAARVKDPLLTGRLLQNVGNAYRFSGDSEAALTVYDQSLAAYATARPELNDLGRIYGARSVLKTDLGDLPGSLADGQMALEAYQRAGDQVGTARTLNNLGLTERALGHYDKAREDFESGLKLARAQKQRLGEAYLLNNIADTYMAQDNASAATEYCLQAIKIKEEIGPKEDLVSSLVNLARIDHHSGKTAEALRLTERASSLAHDSGRSPLIAMALSEWGAIEEEQKHYEVALAKLNEGLLLTQKSSDRLHENEMLELVAETELDMQRYADARRDAGKVLAAAEQMNLPQNIVTSAYALGLAEQHLGNISEARSAFETSVTTIEHLRENATGGAQGRSEFLGHRAEAYQELLSLDVAQGRSEDALQISEREKGRELLDLLTNGRTWLSNELNASEKDEETHLRSHVTVLEGQAQRLSASPHADKAQVAAIHQKLTQAHADMTHFRERMYAVYPDLGRRRGDAPLISLQQSSEFLPDSSTALLEYNVTATATYLFVITRGTDAPVLHVYTIPVAEASLRTRIQAFRTAITTRDPDFLKPASELYRLLLAPAHQQLEGKHTLLIVPSAELWHLPFQALRTPAHGYLVESASVAYAPSLSVLHAYAITHPTAEPGYVLLALGNPAGDLPEASREVQTLEALYGKSGTRVLTGHAASKQSFRTDAERYATIHLATHGVFDDKEPMYSHLLLASADRSTSTGTAQLDASEIAEMKMAADLVVLSACETAEGKYQAGEGLIGLSWSFLAAGSRSTVSSQWRVESASTTALMIAFHRGLRQHLNKAAALRQAQMQLTRNPRYRHPFYWAAFALIGAS